MIRPEEYKNFKRGRITTLFDLENSTGHLYEDTYSGFQKNMLSLPTADQREIRGLMRQSMKSDEAIEPENAEERKLFETAREVGIDINNDTQHKMLREWSKDNFSAKHQPEWMLSIGGLPTLPQRYDDMQEKLKGLAPESLVPDFIKSTGSYGQHDNRSRTLLNRAGINSLNYSVAIAAMTGIN